MKQRRRVDGSQWEAEDLADALTKSGAPVTGTSVRSWIGKGTKPASDRLVALAREFQVEAEPLLEGAIKPINLPQEARSAASGNDVPPQRGRADHDPFIVGVRAMLETMRRQIEALEELVGSDSRAGGIQEMLGSMGRQVNALEKLLLGTTERAGKIPFSALVEDMKAAAELGDRAAGQGGSERRSGDDRRTG